MIFTKDWLKNNITSILAMMFSAGFFTVVIIVLTRQVKTDTNTTFSILASMTSIVTFILGYYFGSSKTFNEKVKSESIKQMDQNINSKP